VTGTLTVVGADGRPATGAARDAVGRARLVIGAQRHLAAAAADLAGGCATVALGPLAPALDRLHATVAAGDPAVVLASGDPGFFGIVRRLRAEGLDPEVVPAVSSVAAAFARVGRSWEGAAVVSAHGRDLAPALNACRALATVAVLTEPGAGAAELGAGLAGWERRLVVAENLGTELERVVELDPAEAAGRDWAHPHVVLSLAPSAGGEELRADNQPAAAPAGGWALPETAYAHRDSMITKAEVRAFAVARLRPRLGRLVWDVGAGSGSVGVECALLGAAVVAVDADPAACDLVAANAARHGVAAAVRVVHGRAPQALTGLPAPDAVFVGGGGADAVTAAIEMAIAAGASRVVVALAALDRVAPVVDVLRLGGFAVEGSQLSASRLADLPGGSLRLAATNPVVVLMGERA
jgi:precorrin-6Y C5,15-methyltransferase (decarboxylating)